MKKIIATVVHLDFEGGFWGLVGDDEQQWLPVDPLPESVHEDGLKVEAEIEPVEAVSFAMWGKPVRVLAIQQL